MFEAVAATEKSSRRELNEDRYLVADPLDLYIVADGMGGQHSGQLAAELSVEVVERFVRRSAETDEITWPYGIDSARSADANRLRTAIKIANRRVWKKAEADPGHVGMGSTIVAVLGNPETGAVTVSWAGDSRAYRLRDGELTRLTEDDSFAAAALSEGALSPEKLTNHPMRNLITKAIGAERTLSPNLIEELETRDGDRFLLCSDGLHKLLEADEIAAILGDDELPLEEVAGELVQAARRKGSDDDVTAVLLRRRPGAPESATPTPR